MLLLLLQELYGDYSCAHTKPRWGAQFLHVSVWVPLELTAECRFLTQGNRFLCGNAPLNMMHGRCHQGVRTGLLAVPCLQQQLHDAPLQLACMHTQWLTYSCCF
jgi:hypothetical protein